MHVACRTGADIHPSEHTICSSNLHGTHARDTGRQLQARTLSHFLKRGQMFARSHSLGISPVSRDCWSKYANTGPSSYASSFRTLGWSSSCPTAFEGFKPLSNWIIPSEDTTIPSMKGADLQVNKTSLYSVLLNAPLNWPISSSALYESNSATPFPPFFLRGGIPCLIFVWLDMYL